MRNETTKYIFAWCPQFWDHGDHVQATKGLECRRCRCVQDQGFVVEDGLWPFWYKFGENNTAIVTSGDERDRDSASTEVNCYWPQIDITKSGDELSKITDKVYYDITVFNNTPTDLGLRALSCTISDPKIGYNETVELATGAKDENLNIEFTIPQTPDDPFVNTASVTCSPTGSTFSVSDSASWETELFQPAVEITKTGPAYAYYGQIITYTFTVTNTGSTDSPTLVFGLDGYVNDTVLGDLTAEATAAGCDELAVGDPCTFTKTYTVPDQGLHPKPITNKVDVLYHPAGFPNRMCSSTARCGATSVMACPL